MAKTYTPRDIEPKWQKIWAKKGLYKLDLTEAKKPYYNLMMFPYPSAEGLHVGNVYAFTGSDIHGRFRRMQGHDVFEPMGFDAFGIHSENFAIDKGIHPKTLIEKNIKHFRENQLKRLGALFDWSHEVQTTDPAYYKWTQWIFLKLFKAGLAERRQAPVNYCPSCKTVLADEQVISGKCERCDSEVEEKLLLQWFFKITKYASKLLENLSKIDWDEAVKTAQFNWIGRAESTEIDFAIKNLNKKIKIVTTRADTIFGSTFVVIAPEHPMIGELKPKIKNYKEVENYVHQATKKTDFERGLLAKDKTGVKLEGIIAINPVNNEEIPVYISDFVLITYGTGAIMAVPAHDNRDFEFAKKFQLPIIKVIEKPINPDVLAIHIYDEDNSEAANSLRKMGKALEYITPTVRTYHISSKDINKVIEVLKKENTGTESDYQLIRKGSDFNLEIEPRSLSFVSVYTEDGRHINSGFINDLYKDEAIEKMHKWLKDRKIGGPAVYYHLRDWLISRQRYWGPPIPIIYCEKCGAVPVPEKDLPVLLPEVKNFQPKGTGKSPLAEVESFINTKCPKCQGKAKRETDVSDNFLDSSWYFLRYPSAHSKKVVFEKDLTKKWLPVDMYIGGREHSVLHLMYTRFLTMALSDLELIDFEEPFKKFRAHGLLTRHGAKMSKSRGNVVNPDEYFASHGADTLRTYLMFLGPFDEGGDWSDRGIEGVWRFINRVYNLVTSKKIVKEVTKEEKVYIAKTIKKVTEDLENLKYNTAIATLMTYLNFLSEKDKISKYACETLLLLLAPFAPHITEELWQFLGNKYSIHNESWPKYDPRQIIEDKVTIVVQVNGRLRGQMEMDKGAKRDEIEEKALSLPRVQQHFDNKKAKKRIYVPDKLINFVLE